MNRKVVLYEKIDGTIPVEVFSMNRTSKKLWAMMAFGNLG
jgi:hypothetical protein